MYVKLYLTYHKKVKFEFHYNIALSFNAKWKIKKDINLYTILLVASAYGGWSIFFQINIKSYIIKSTTKLNSEEKFKLESP